MELGPYGIWSAGLREGELGAAADAAAELEELGFGAAWIPGRGDDIFERAGALLGATSRLVVATGIIWNTTPEEVAAAHAWLTDAFPGRFLLGLGISHGPLVDRDDPGRYRKPLTKMREYLDALDGRADAVPKDDRIIAALHPKMLALARERSLGTHPYLVPPAHTEQARAILGSGPILAPEQSVILDADAERARSLARQHLTTYLGLPNYTKNWLYHGLDESDLLDGGSDRLVDSIVAWGTVEQAAERVRSHQKAGADHVCLQLVGGERTQLYRDEWRALAAALGLSA
jgi:probable F420-dependent oxidoreductase